MEPVNARAPRKKYSFILEILFFSAIALAIVIPFRIYVAQPFIVSGASMTPTIQPADYLVIDMLSYRVREPERGEVVIFRYPFNPSTFFVKRVIGLPGETVTIRGGVVTITTVSGDSLSLNEPYIVDDNRTLENKTETLADGEYFVMGDNRRGSSDSRVWGPLQEKFLLGRALVRLYPLTNIELFPGAHSWK